MPYDRTDPRAALTGHDLGDSHPADGIARPSLIEFRSANAGTQTSNTRVWAVRAQNLVLEYCELQPGATLHSPDDPDESLVLIVPEAGTAAAAPETGDGAGGADGPHVSVTWSSEQVELSGAGIVTVPSGRHAVTAHAPTRLVRLFTTTLRARAAAALNATDYQRPHPRVRPLRRWPVPPGPPRLRCYRLADFPPKPGRFGAIFRSQAFMVNFLPSQVGPRDANALSPHAHDDFEQISLAVDGTFVHHVRTPWTPRRSEWVEDVHWRTVAPSLAIIPPPTVHTSENVAPGRNALIDIFSPPRADFSARPGWVLNAGDYPVPADEVLS